MSSTTNSPTITIFGSTGGSGQALLRLCLRASLQVTILVRNPTKILTLLSLDTAPSNLRIITGDIRDPAAVSSALLTVDGKLSDIVLSSIGSTPPTGWNAIFNPSKGFDATICADGSKNIIASIKALKSEGKATSQGGSKGPLLIAYSTTGISDAGRDVPWIMYPLYKWMLETPHKDKKVQERNLEAERDSLRWIIIRPSLLLSKTELAEEGKPIAQGRKIRVGVEYNKKYEVSAIGNWITREATAEWVFRELVRADAVRYEGRMISLTF